MTATNRTERLRPSLDQVLAYQNPHLVANFLKTFAVSEQEAADLFDQLKRMLWLQNEMQFDEIPHKEGFFIDNSLVVLDEMWHKFILFTQEYESFCLKMFGRYTHHAPNTESEEVFRSQFEGLSQEERTAKIMEMKRWQYHYVANKLGKDCFLKWYSEYHNKYTAAHLHELRGLKLRGGAPAAEAGLAAVG